MSLYIFLSLFNFLFESVEIKIVDHIYFQIIRLEFFSTFPREHFFQFDFFLMPQENCFSLYLLENLHSETLGEAFTTLMIFHL